MIQWFLQALEQEHRKWAVLLAHSWKAAWHVGEKNKGAGELRTLWLIESDQLWCPYGIKWCQEDCHKFRGRKNLRGWKPQWDLKLSSANGKTGKTGNCGQRAKFPNSWFQRKKSEWPRELHCYRQVRDKYLNTVNNVFLGIWNKTGMPC